MKNDQSRNIIIVLLVVTIIILVGLVVLFATDTINLNSNKTNNNQLLNENNQTDDTNINNQENVSIQDELGKNDTFTNNDSGIVEVIGYPVIKELTDEINTGEKYNYVYFNIIETKSGEFKKYLESLKGNSFALDNAIGLGCVIGSKIKYSNSSDDVKLKEYELSLEDSDKILNASESSPIKLKLEKLPLTYGGDAPICYSHITTIEVEN